MLRKVCVVKMLSNNTLDLVYGLRRREVRRTVAHFYGRVGSEVNVGEQMFLTTLNVITSMMWGGALEGAAEREHFGAEFRQAVGEMTDLLGKPNLSDFYPGLARFDLQGVTRQMASLVRRFDSIFDKMIDQRSLKMDGDGGGDGGGDGDGKKKDFLQFLLELKDEENSKTPLTMVHVKALLMVLALFS